MPRRASLATRAPERRPIRLVRLAGPDDLEGWREAARALAMLRVAPDEVEWRVAAEATLFDAPTPAPPAPAGAFSVPRAFLELSATVVRHHDPDRFALLYAFLCRLRDRPRAMEDRADPLLRRLGLMAEAVRRKTRENTPLFRWGGTG